MVVRVPALTAACVNSMYSESGDTLDDDGETAPDRPHVVRDLDREIVPSRAQRQPIRMQAQGTARVNSSMAQTRRRRWCGSG